MRLPTLAVGSAVTILALSGLVASTASATPGTGTTRTDFVDGILAGPDVAKADGIKLKNRQDATVRTFTLTYAVGGDSGWHEHPGIVIAVVKSGTVHRKSVAIGQRGSPPARRLRRSDRTSSAIPGMCRPFWRSPRSSRRTPRRSSARTCPSRGAAHS